MISARSTIREWMLHGCVSNSVPTFSTVADTEKLIAAIKVPVNKFERIYLVFNAPMKYGGGFRVFMLPQKAVAVEESTN
jgi:hypothetical protein